MVYFISESGTNNIKIGYTKDDISVRIQSLQTGNPRKLTLIGIIYKGTMKLEKELHSRWKNYKIKDNSEWFILKKDSDLLKYLNEISEYYIDIDDINKSLLIYNKMKN